MRAARLEQLYGCAFWRSSSSPDAEPRSKLQKFTILNILEAQTPPADGSFELRPRTSLLIM